MPLNGLCQQLTVVSGTGYIITWPAAPVVGMGASLPGQYKWLFQEMDLAHFKKWATRSFEIARVKPGDQVWVPMSFYAGIIASCSTAGTRSSCWRCPWCQLR